MTAVACAKPRFADMGLVFEGGRRRLLSLAVAAAAVSVTIALTEGARDAGSAGDESLILFTRMSPAALEKRAGPLLGERLESVAADGMLFIATPTHLYAIKKSS